MRPRRYFDLLLVVVVMHVPTYGAHNAPHRETDPPLQVSPRVVDAESGTRIDDAILTPGAGVIRARAAGYVRADVTIETLRGRAPEIRLTPFRPKALYLSVYGIGDRRLRAAALALIDTTELNALVIDIKGDRGIVPYPSQTGLAATPGAQRVITIRDLRGLVADLRARGIYTIARIVVFKDDLLASVKPELAVRRQDGSLFRDREGLAWANPYSRDVWRYNIGLALEAARAGFDEIQFDYARLPDATGLIYEKPWTEVYRTAAIDGFLSEARTALAPFNVFVAVDVFGYVCWNPGDTKIGQRLESMAGIVDYVSPMLYPSSFQFGIPGYRRPVEHPYEIVRLSLEQARRRTAVRPAHFRPWLQAFRDYAFGGRAFAAAEIRSQIKAAEDFGAGGWMLWNSRNEYSAAGLEPQKGR